MSKSILRQSFGLKKSGSDLLKIDLKFKVSLKEIDYKGEQKIYFSLDLLFIKKKKS